MRRWAAIFLLSFGSCVAHVPEPTIEDAGGDPARLSQLTRGRRLYVTKCSGCHRLYSVEEYSDRDWRHYTREMIAKKKVKLLEKELDCLVEYLSAVNERE